MYDNNKKKQKAIYSTNYVKYKIYNKENISQKTAFLMPSKSQKQQTKGSTLDGAK